MLTLYQRETCPYCKPVRELLTELQISYVNVNVPKPRGERRALRDATGSIFIPALVDGEMVVAGVLEDNSAVIDYLRRTYGPAMATPDVPVACDTSS